MAKLPIEWRGKFGGGCDRDGEQRTANGELLNVVILSGAPRRGAQSKDLYPNARREVLRLRPLRGLRSG
jgi:hypothetical protein